MLIPLECASFAQTSSTIGADYARDVQPCAVHNSHVDTGWFKRRKAELGITDTEVAAAIGRERSVANKIINGVIPFDLQYLDGLAEAMKVTREEILRRAGALQEEAGEETQTNAVPVRMEGPSRERPQENLPVFGTGLGAAREIDGEAIEQTTLNTGSTIQWVQRPVLLNKRADAYGLYIQGSSMHPALPDGEMVAVSPNMPLRVGDNVVVYLRPINPDDDDGESARAVLVKELVRRTARYVELRQYQPPKDFQIPMEEVVRIDRVLTRAEMLTNAR